MALDFKGIAVNAGNGGTDGVFVPAGITVTILSPEPAFDPNLVGSWEKEAFYEERVTQIIPSGQTNEAANFDAIFNYIQNEVVTEAANFNSTNKNVEIWGRIEGIAIQENELYQRPSAMAIDYEVSVTIYVTVT